MGKTLYLKNQIADAYVRMILYLYATITYDLCE